MTDSEQSILSRHRLQASADVRFCRFLLMLYALMPNSVPAVMSDYFNSRQRFQIDVQVHLSYRGESMHSY